MTCLVCQMPMNEALDGHLDPSDDWGHMAVPALRSRVGKGTKYGEGSDPWFVLGMLIDTDYHMCLGAMEQAMAGVS